MGGAGQDGATGEVDCDIAAAVFQYDGNWTGGYANGTTGSIVIDGLGTCSVAQSGTGQYNLSISGANSNTGGLLFAIAANNNNEVASVDALGDGSGWTVNIFEGTDGSSLNADFAFLYLPFGVFEGHEIDGLLAGQIAADGSKVVSEGDFSLTHSATGEYLLSIAGETPETGMLLLTADGAADNVLSYAASGDSFLIKSNDLGNGTAGLLEDCGFNFAFVSFDDPMQVVEATVTIPGDADRDGDVDADDAKTTGHELGHGQRRHVGDGRFQRGRRGERGRRLDPRRQLGLWRRRIGRRARADERRHAARAGRDGARRPPPRLTRGESSTPCPFRRARGRPRTRPSPAVGGPGAALRSIPLVLRRDL